MRTIISGPVDQSAIDTAELLYGITPTAWVTNGKWPYPPLPPGGYADIHPIDSKLGHLGEDARDYTLCQHAEAAIIVGGNPHLAAVARQYGLLVHEE
jgi:hypothetical protein